MQFFHVMILLFFVGRLSAAELPTLMSPDGMVQLKLSAPNGQLSFEVKLDGTVVLENSPVGIQLGGKEITKNATFVKVSSIERKETYAIFGAHSTATNHFNGSIVEFTATGGEPFIFELRAFNDGIAFRHRIPGDGTRVPDETTAFTLPEGTAVWHHDLGGHYEDVHTKSLVTELNVGGWIAPPMTFKLADGNIYGAITEAALLNYSGMALQVTGDRKLSIGLGHKHPISYPFRLRYSNDVERVTKPFSISGAILSPWRVVLLGRNLNDLVNSDIVNNLSDAPDPRLFPEGNRTAWIRPGRAVWKYLDGGANTFENMKDFSRWAGELGFEHHVIEGFWSRWSDEQIRELAAYSKERKVGLWFWRHSRELRTPEKQDAFFKRLETNGVIGAKIDFFDHEHGDVANLYVQLLQKAAQHKIMVNFHGANKPTGESRTWPNELIREGVRGMESSRLQARALHNTTLPFTRYLAGTGDYTPVHFGARKGDTTAAHQVATAALFNEPLLTYAAHPTNLLSHPALPMIELIPAVWDETIVLPSSEIGQIALFARRSGPNWFLVVANGPKPKMATVPLTFLGAGDYTAMELADDEQNRDGVLLRERRVSASDEVALQLTEGGGYITRFSRN
jgi:alpha-glucosidase